MKRKGALPGLGMLVVAVVLATGSFFVLQAGAADKDEVVISETQLNDSWNGGPYTGGTITPSTCDPANATCDSISLKVDGIAPGYWDTHRGGVEVQVVPEQSESADFDIFVYDKDGDEVVAGEAAGSTTERVLIPKANSTDGPYEIVVMPYVGTTQASYKGGVRLESRAEASAADVPTQPVSNAPCVDGKSAGAFPCKGIDLDGLPAAELARSRQQRRRQPQRHLGLDRPADRQGIRAGREDRRHHVRRRDRREGAEGARRAAVAPAGGDHLQHLA